MADSRAMAARLNPILAKSTIAIGGGEANEHHMEALRETLLAALPGDPIGRRLAQRLEPTHVGLVGALLAHSRTLGEALGRTMQAQRLLSDEPLWLTRPSPGGGVIISLAAPPPWARRLGHPVEAMLLGALAMARVVTHSELAPRVLRFRYAPREASGQAGRCCSMAGDRRRARRRGRPRTKRRPHRAG